MTEALPRTPRQPKLRSSCDRCASAKLKCDRGQPSCGRCNTLGLNCVYGVSRKMGKPPRDRLRTSGASFTSRIQNGPAGRVERERSDNKGCMSDHEGSTGDDFNLYLEPISNNDHLPLAWNSVDDYPENSLANIAGLDGWNCSLPGPSISDLSSLAFSNDPLLTNLETRHIFVQRPPDMESYPTPATIQSHVDESSIPINGGNDHDCSIEARGILHSLASLGLDRAHHTSQLSSDSFLETPRAAHCVPFDHILRLNHDSRERLERLLGCSCGKYPHLALLYASVISLALTVYLQAAGCAERTSWSFSARAEEIMTPRVSPSEHMPETPSPWSRTAMGTASTNSPTLVVASPSTATPTQMAIGSFTIDDQQVQTVLKLQLLLSEVGRTGHLIDHFASQRSNGRDQFASGGVDGLYQSLGSWLRNEQSRVSDLLRSRLKEVGA